VIINNFNLIKGVVMSKDFKELSEFLDSNLEKLEEIREDLTKDWYECPHCKDLFPSEILEDNEIVYKDYTGKPNIYGIYPENVEYLCDDCYEAYKENYEEE
jgi:hypothetical protein